MNLLLAIKSGILQAVAYSCFLQPLHPIEVAQARELAESSEKTSWVNAQYAAMSNDERIGQLFMIDGYTYADKQNKATLINLVRNYKVGGIIFFKGNPIIQAQWTNELQAYAKTPLMIGIDGEWGVNMRLEKTIQYPHHLTLGAIRNNELIYETGKQIGWECKRLGIHVNFAPVVDINNNPLNPVINDRSFGEDKYNVAIKGISFMEGMQSMGVMACAKHFPGHGDVSDDSHVSLPLINHNKEHLMNFELMPFKAMINNGVSGVMAAHLNVPALDNSGLPSSLSKKITTYYLRDSFGFKGLVFSDALNMKGASNALPQGTMEVEAFKAGNDVLLFSENIPLAISKLKDALNRGEITEADIERSVKRILAAKYDAGLHQYTPVDLNGIEADLNSVQGLLLKQHLFENAITLVNNSKMNLPYRIYGSQRFALLEIGENKYDDLHTMLNNYAVVDRFKMEKSANSEERAAMLQKLAAYDHVIISMHEMSRKPSIQYGIYDNSVQFAYQVSEKTDVAVVLFGTPYAAKKFAQIPGLWVAYEDNEYAQRAAAQAMFGGIPVLGKMPVSSGNSIMAGSGELIDSNYRLKFTVPEELQLSSASFNKIDAIVQKAIQAGATPGAQVLVAKEGKVIYQKAFGYADYSRTQAVQNSDLYDIASITKICATTLGAMKLYENGKLSLDNSVSDYLSLASDATIGNIKVKDLLLHEAGLTPFIPFYKKTIDDPQLYAATYRTTSTVGYSNAVTRNMYISNSYAESMWDIIQHSDLSGQRKFVYSDLSMYILRRIIDKQNDNSLDQYVQESFYYKMGLQRLTYKPTDKFDIKRIMPTENDLLFRKQQIRGYVHDPGAAMMGGVSGHAGLFSNAADLAALMQMYLNGGSYNGRQFLQKETINTFTTKQSTISRRGYGFDKPEPNADKTNPCSASTPLSAYGHTGFTGTCVWVDPDNQLIYVFLSNRVCPNAENWKLVSMSVRTEIQEAIYNAIRK